MRYHSAVNAPAIGLLTCTVVAWSSIRAHCEIFHPAGNFKETPNSGSRYSVAPSAPGTAAYGTCPGHGAGGFLRAAVVFSTNRMASKFSGATWSAISANGSPAGYIAPILQIG